MGILLSRLMGNNVKMQTAWSRMKKLLSNAWWMSTNTIWMVATAGIVLAVPVVFFYEKECQMAEMQAQFEAVHKAANAPQLTG